MSIYCSYFTIGDEHDDKCKRVRKVSTRKNGYYEYDDSKPCTCGACPIEYRGSHILPTDNDQRNGVFGISAIPNHITEPEGDFLPWKLFLRVHVNDATVIITRTQAENLRDSLTRWLKDSSK